MIKHEIAEKINKITKSGDFKNYESDIVLYFEKPNLVNYFYRKMGSKHDDLNDIDFILELLIEKEDFYNGPYIAFQILDKSVSVDNNQFILDFLRRKYKSFEKPKLSKEDSIDLVVELLAKVLKSDSTKAEEVFELLTKIANKKGHTDRKNLRDFRLSSNFEKQKISDLVALISDIYLEKPDQDKMKELVSYISDNFNLVDDDSRLEMHTPRKVFKILKEYIGLNFEDNFIEIK